MQPIIDHIQITVKATMPAFLKTPMASNTKLFSRIGNLKADKLIQVILTKIMDYF